MRAVPQVLAALLAILMSAMTPAWAGSAQYLEYEGTAHLHKSTQFAYGEHHFLTFRQGRLAERVVLYTCADRSAFARKTVAYRTLMAPDFLLEDASTGMREGVREEQGRRVMFFRASAEEAERSAPLAEMPNLVIDAGFDEFVIQNWQKLASGGRQKMEFLVPSRREAMSFEVEHLRSEQVRGEESEVFRLKLAGVLGWLMSGIDVAYSKAQHVLLRYEGLSDLRDARGDNVSADIYFDPAVRRPGTELATAAAQRAVLARCPTP